MEDPGSEIIECVPPAGPEASESTPEENEDDIQFVSEGPSRPVLEYIDLICGDDKERSTYHSDILFPKMPKRQGDLLHFLNVKKVKTGTESNNRNKNYCGLSKSKESNFKYVEQPIIEEKPSCSSKEEMDNLVLSDCWNEKQAFMFTEQYKWLEIKEDMNMNEL
ncbi:E3 SUMO-protein ligase KIAA1586 homolog isoform X1 [Tursiops truncatus]|uniref:E3 SUMO-protein ligase KIAA1586 homolog isoform X1 n=1 Tax=Tursiops truncatus TaxID=9739 RepID=UPI003CCFBDE8